MGLIRTLGLIRTPVSCQFGRIKKKFRGKNKKDDEKKEEPEKKEEEEEEDEEDEDDEDGDLSKYKLDVSAMCKWNRFVVALLNTPWP